MAQTNEIWVVAESSSAMRELMSEARKLAEKTVLVTAASKEETCGADKAYCFATGDSRSYLACVPALVDAAKDAAPDVMLVEASRNGRLAAAALAVSFSTAALCDVIDFTMGDGFVEVRRMVYGGVAIKTERVRTPTAVIVVGEGTFQADDLPVVTCVEELAVDDSAVKFIERRSRETANVNLAAAKNVVGVGRGLGNVDNLRVVNDFAAAIQAEVGCTRPLAEEDKLLPKETYIGVSGKMLKPDCYVGIGISGQVQHMVGVMPARIVAAINKDKNAPIFKQCDFGIVGDLETIVPAITERLKK